jgi:hypothetical protein
MAKQWSPAWHVKSNCLLAATALLYAAPQSAAHNGACSAETRIARQMLLSFSMRPITAPSRLSVVSAIPFFSASDF